MKGNTILDDHSEAKISLYNKYLSIYLNVLSRSVINEIFIVDFFCGEGIYENNGKGSPIVTLECIKNHYYGNGNKCPNITIAFNDSGYSEIEPTKLKITRVQEAAKTIFIPENVKVAYTNIDYQILLEKIITRTNSLSNSERALLFIDPWGYKEIRPNDLRQLLENGKTEIILFLPIYFMSRFAKKAKNEEFKGGQALRNFLGELFGSMDELPHYDSQHQFIQIIMDQFKIYLSMDYIDSFKIERGNNQWFALFFFTSNEKGFYKMLESKWAIDKKGGSSFKQEDRDTVEMFDEIMIKDFDNKVLDLLRSNPNLTNKDLFRFGLKNNFLPKHTKQVLDALKKKHELQLISLDGKPAAGYYLGNDDRLINIKIQ